MDTQRGEEPGKGTAATRQGGGTPPPPPGSGPPRRSGPRRWAARLAALVLGPLLFLLLLEILLRVIGFGYPASFFIDVAGRNSLTGNPRFGWRFFPPPAARVPAPLCFPKKKEKDTYRIFVLGGSAAWGSPDPSFGFGRVLEAMLRARYPGERFEVINAAMVAINSHVVLPIAEECARLDPNLFIVYLGNNEVIGPYGAGTVFSGFSPNLALIRASIRARATRTGQLISSIARSLLGRNEAVTEWRGMAMFVENRVAACDHRMAKVYDHFARNLADICAAGRGAGADVILGTVAVNLRDSPPFASLHREGLSRAELREWENLYAEGIAVEEKGDPAAALGFYGRAAAIDSSYAELAFRMARCLLARGDAEAARRRFAEARDLDALRFRADSRINAIIRQTAEAAGDDGVRLVDAEEAFARDSRSREGIPGQEFFYEHVHMNFDGNCLLARTILKEVEKLLPEEVSRRRDPKAGVLTNEECAAALALTDWNLLEMAREIARITMHPPFTGRLDNDRRTKELQRMLADLEKRTGPEGLAKAAAVYKEAVAKSPDSLDLRINYAKLEALRGDFAGAAAQRKAILKMLPDSWKDLYFLGNCLAGLGDNEGAAARFEESLEINPDFAAAHNAVAKVLERLDRKDEAASHFEKALRLDPGSAEIHTEYGNLLARQGRLDEAYAHYEKALEALPGDERILKDMANVLIMQGRTDDAVSLYRDRLKGNPDRAEGHLRVGRILLEAGRTAQAAAQFEAALRARPDFAEAHDALGNILASRGDPAGAEKHFEEALRIRPDYGKARFDAGRACALLGRSKEAVDHLKEAIRLEPKNPAPKNSLARILAVSRDPSLRDAEEAVRLAQRACDLTGAARPGYLETLAVALAAAGRFEEAARTAEKALALARRSGKARLAAGLRRKIALFKAKKPFAPGAAGPAGNR